MHCVSTWPAGLCIWSDPLVSTTVTLILVQISLGARILRPWGIVCVVAAATQWQVFIGVRDGSIAGSSSFTFPPELLEQPVACCVALSLAGPFEDCHLICLRLVTLFQSLVNFNLYSVCVQIHGVE